MNNRMPGEKQINGNSCSPDKILIVGLDTEDGPEHPLYDGPANTAPVNQGLVNVMLQEGFVGTITVRKTPRGFEAVDGRQRIKACREAWKQCKDAAKRDLLKIKLVYENGDAKTLLAMSGMLNEHRREVNDIDRANLAARLRNTGKTLDEVGVILDGRSGQHVANLIKLLDLVPELQDKVRTGELGVTAALALAKKSPEKQKETLKAAIAAKQVAEQNVAKTGKMKPAKKRQRRTKITAKDINHAEGKPKKRTKRAMLDFLEEREGTLAKKFVEGARWALGELTDEDVGLSHD
jgi:ParB/RepB/Spo0J family partition protein